MNKEEIKEILEELENMYEISELEEQVNNINKIRDYIINLQQENKRLNDNWNKLKEDLINDINYWHEQEKEWIKLGFIQFGGEANTKIIFKKVLDKMQELQGSDSNGNN